MISWDLGKIVVSKKTGSLSLLDCKVSMNRGTKDEFILFGLHKGKMLGHPILDSQGFSFVP